MEYDKVIILSQMCTKGEELDSSRERNISSCAAEGWGRVREGI